MANRWSGAFDVATPTATSLKTAMPMSRYNCNRIITSSCGSGNSSSSSSNYEAASAEAVVQQPSQSFGVLLVVEKTCHLIVFISLVYSCELRLGSSSVGCGSGHYEASSVTK